MDIYYTIYQIENVENGMFYVGQHRTDNIDDGYMGSGTYIRNAILKHGIEKFQKTILYVYDNFDEMNEKEKELVDHDFIQRSDTYNIIPGGYGLSPEDYRRISDKKLNEMGYSHHMQLPEYKELFSEIAKGNTNNRGKYTVYNSEVDTIKLVSKEDFYSLYEYDPQWVRGRHKDRMVINNGTNNKFIPSDSLDQYTELGWEVGMIGNGVKGLISVIKDGEEKRIPKEIYQEYVNHGWVKGTYNKGNTGYKAINNNGEVKHVKESELNDWLNSGWNLGSSRIPVKDPTWVNNGKETKFIPKSELKQYLESGWVKGSLQRTVKGHIHINDGHSIKSIDKSELPEWEKLGWVKGTIQDHNSNRKMINNGIDQIMAKQEDLNWYLNNGWTLGSIKKRSNRGKKWVNKDGIEKCIHPDELTHYINNDWRKGYSKPRN